MKKLFFLLILLLSQIDFYGQQTERKMFVNEINIECDSIDADYYLRIIKPKPRNVYEIIEKYTLDSILLSRIDYFNTSTGYVKQGKSEHFDKNGNLRVLKQYKNNKLNGNYESFYETGERRRIEYYKRGKLKKGSCFTKSGQDTTWYPSEVLPTFTEGYDAYVKFLNENIVYPELAIEQKIQGRVIIGMKITEEGRIEDVRVLKSVHPLLDKEALRIANLTDKKWNPGLKENKVVTVQYNVPVNFRIK